MENNSANIEDDKEPINGETISQLAHRHMLNKNHHTTDEELRNAKIEYDGKGEDFLEAVYGLSDADNSTVIPPAPIEKDDNTDDRDADTNNPLSSPPNPYEVLK